jgi:hypothetical protein
MITGSCLCGGVQFEIDGELAPIQVCHCQQCRKAQGGAFATNIPLPAERLRLRSGESLLRAYESSPGKRRWFCSHCGSPLYSRRDSQPGIVRLRAGLLDGDLATRPALHFFVADRCNWWTINDALPQYAGALP